jgi:tetratricopeptide (TPR) repeat protein
MSARTLTALLLVLGVAVSAGAAAPRGRTEALAALDARDAETRRLGAAELAQRGTMEDVPRMARALHDSDPFVRAIIERSLWDVWGRSGETEIDALFANGVQEMSEGLGEAAVQTFTRIIERRPDFAEGWNKRATVLYMLGEYQKSLADCDEVMKRNPYHFGALSGYGMIYLKLGDPARALTYFERALAVNPNLTQVEETAQALRRLLIERRRNTT